MKIKETVKILTFVLSLAGGHVVSRAAEEVAGPVLLAGQVGAPGRDAGAAVVERAARAGAVGRLLRPQQRVAAHRAADLQRCQRRDAAVVRRALHIAPTAAGPAHLDDGDAVHRDFLVGLGRRARIDGAAVRVQPVGAHVGVAARALAPAQRISLVSPDK